MDREDVVHVYSGILFSHEKEGHPATATTLMDHEGITLSKISQAKTNSVGLHLYVKSKKTELIETENRVVFTRDWEAEEMGRFWSRGKNFQL